MEDESARIIGMVLNGLKYIHSRDIIHRDIKTENIIIHHDK